MSGRRMTVACAAVLLLALIGCGKGEPASVPEPVRPVAACGCTAGFSEGKGTAEEPFVIRNAEELMHIEAHGTCAFMLAENVSLAGAVWTPLCGASPFAGTLDGAGHAIRDLTGALFDAVGEDGTVCNLSLSGEVRLEAGAVAAGSAANASAGTVRAVDSAVSVTAEAGAARDACIGGLVGLNTGMVRDCVYTGTLSDLRKDGTNAGAIVGLSRVTPSEGLPTMITAHSGFGEGQGSDDHREWASLDWIIRGFNYLPDFVEVDLIRVPTADGTDYIGIGHEISTARLGGVTFAEILSLYTGSHARSGELVDGYENVRLQIDCKKGGLLKDVLDMVRQAGIPWNRLGLVGGISREDVVENYATLCEGIHEGLYFAFSPGYVQGFSTEKLLADPDAFIKAFRETYRELNCETDTVVISVSQLYVTRELVEKLNGAGFHVTSATVKSAADIEKCMQIGLYNMTTMAEDALFLRNGLRDGAMYNTYADGFPEIGTVRHD